MPPPNTKAVFCTPPNADLIAFWHRVEDRLFKIRKCMEHESVLASIKEAIRLWLDYAAEFGHPTPELKSRRLMVA